MPRKKATRATAQRTFHLPSHVATAFDKVCEYFDEPADRVARKFFEDALRKIAIDFRLDAVLEVLGEEKKSPFDVFSAPQNYEYRAPVAPPLSVAQYSNQSNWSNTLQNMGMEPIPTGDLVLPSGGPPVPRQVDEG